MQATQVSFGGWLGREIRSIFTMECYSAIKEKEILPFSTTNEDILLSEISHLYVEPKKAELRKTEEIGSC